MLEQQHRSLEEDRRLERLEDADLREALQRSLEDLCFVVAFFICYCVYNMSIFMIFAVLQKQEAAGVTQAAEDDEAWQQTAALLLFPLVAQGLNKIAKRCP